MHHDDHDNGPRLGLFSFYNTLFLPALAAEVLKLFNIIKLLCNQYWSRAPLSCRCHSYSIYILGSYSWRSAVRIPRQRSTHFCHIPRTFGIAHEFWQSDLNFLSILYAQLQILLHTSVRLCSMQRVLVDLSWLTIACMRMRMHMRDIGLYTNVRTNGKY